MKVAHLYLSEEQIEHILKHLPDDDKFARPILQEAGINIFGW